MKKLTVKEFQSIPLKSILYLGKDSYGYKEDIDTIVCCSLNGEYKKIDIYSLKHKHKYAHKSFKNFFIKDKPIYNFKIITSDKEYNKAIYAFKWALPKAVYREFLYDYEEYVVYNEPSASLSDGIFDEWIREYQTRTYDEMLGYLRVRGV